MGSVPDLRKVEQVETVIEDPRWVVAGLEAVAHRAALVALEHLQLEPDAFEFCVLGCDDGRIAALNREFRGQSRATNVLSWPSHGRAPKTHGGDPRFPAGGELGDIAIAYETCAREAEQQGRPIADHVTHLVVHGLLHLLGYDHADERDAERMETLETEILANLGIRSPY